MATLPGWPRSYGAAVTKGRHGRGVEEDAETPAEPCDPVAVAGQPRAHPLRALEERERGPTGAPEGAAPHEPAGVDEADVFEDAAACSEPGRDRSRLGERS